MSLHLKQVALPTAQRLPGQTRSSGSDSFRQGLNSRVCFNRLVYMCGEPSCICIVVTPRHRSSGWCTKHVHTLGPIEDI